MTLFLRNEDEQHEIIIASSNLRILRLTVEEFLAVVVETKTNRLVVYTKNLL